MKKRSHRKPAEFFKFTVMDELMANPTAPVPKVKLDGHLLRVHQALESLMRDEKPENAAWCSLSDAVNIAESLVVMGVLEDQGGAVTSAKDALGKAGAQALDGHALRLSGEGLRAVCGLLADYDELVVALTERQFIQACRVTERRLREILRGAVQPGDVVVAL